MILRFNITTEMKNFTTGILCTLMLCFFAINPTTAQDSWDENTFIIRFDPSINQDTIDSIRMDYLATELWVSPLTQTRLWHVDEEYPHWNAAQTDYFIDVQHNNAAARGKTGSQGGSGLNYSVSSGPNNGFGNTQGSTGGPQNPYPTNPDNQMNCHSEMSTSILTGSNPVTVGVFDTGNSEFQYFPDYYWMYAFDQTGQNYIDSGNPWDFRDWNGHGNHISSTITHLVHKAYGSGLISENPNVAYRHMKTFTAAAKGPIAEIILALETEIANGLQIANLSWRFIADEGEADLHPLKKTMEVAEDLYDVLFVCAAGNDGDNIDDGISGGSGVFGLNAYPASYDFDNILSVASFNCQNYFTSFSNIGATNVDIAAPGLEIPGIWTDNFGQFELDYLDGTSMSCAITTAAAIQLATHQTSFDAQEIKCAIMEGADYMPLMDPFLASAGILNLDSAMAILGNCNNGGSGAPKRNLGGSFTGSSEINLGISPNPSIGEIELSMDSEVERFGQINIFNSVGKLVVQKNITISAGPNTVELNLTDLKSGLYNLILDYGAGIESHKLSIMR